MSMYEQLPAREQQILKIITIISVVFLIYLFFVRQQIIAAMIVGGVLVVAQKVFLRLRTKNFKKEAK